MSAQGFDAGPGRRIARNVGWLTVQEVSTRILGLVTTIWLTRFLTPTDFGALGIALAVAGVAVTVVRAGTGLRATRETARNAGDVPRIHAEMTGLRLVLSALIIGAICVFSEPLGAALSVPPLLLILASFLVLRPALTVRWAFKGLDRMDVPAIAEVIEKSLLLLGVVLLVRGGANDVYRVPVIEVVAGLLVSFGLYRVLMRSYPDLRIRLAVSAWPGIAREALPVSLATLLGAVYLHGGVLLLGWGGQAAGAAAFLVAHKVMFTVAGLVQVLNKAAFPSASRLMAQTPGAALELGAGLLRGFLLLTLPVILGIAWHAEFLLGAVFGANFRDAAPALRVLLVALPFVALATTLQVTLMAIPRPGAVLAGRVAGAVCLLAVGAWSVLAHGALGAAIALMAGEAVSALWLAVATHRATGGLPWNRGCSLALLWAAVAAVGQPLVGGGPVATGAALTAYAIGCFLTGAVSAGDFRHLPASFARRRSRSEATGKQRRTEQDIEEDP